MRSQRQLRVGEEIRHALAGFLQRGDVPWEAGFRAPAITVTEVRISPDLRNATAFVMPLGGERVAETLRALNDLAGYFRHVLAKAVALRYVPKLGFRADESFDEAEKIERILHDPRVAKDLQPKPEPAKKTLKTRQKAPKTTSKAPKMASKTPPKS